MQRNLSNEKKRILKLIILMCIILCACGRVGGQNSAENGQEQIDTGFRIMGPESYDSADTAVVMEVNTEEQKISFWNFQVSKQYTLELDGTSSLYDKYNGALSLQQIQAGDIVDILFLKSKKHLTSLKKSDVAWSYEQVEKYEMDQIRKEVYIGQDVYGLTADTKFFSDGRSISPEDINASDVLSFQGMDNRILSVCVERGHGYLRLLNDQSFIGGWIEVGKSQIQRITEDMLLTVPEGSYDVAISYKGSGGNKHVVINRNSETSLDIGDLKIAEPEYGLVIFSVDPAEATVYIDGTKVDITAPVSLEYGIHQMIARASGYQTITQYIRVSEESVGISVVLEEKAGDDIEEDSTGDSGEESADASSDAVGSYYKVYVEAPEGVEVYLDGNYVGISPCSFKKEIGARIITLRKTGYQTRSYTVQFIDDKKDETYSFAELEKENEVQQPSETPSASQEPSGTPSASQEPSGTPSASQEPSGTPSASQQPSETPSASQEPSGTPSASQQPSETPSASQEPSGTPSASQ